MGGGRKPGPRRSRAVSLFQSVSFWIVKKWYGILVAQGILFAAVYLTIWQIIEPFGLPDTLLEPGCGFPFNRRVFWHLVLTLSISPLLTSILDAAVRRKLWRSPELMRKVEREFASHLGNTADNVIEPMRLPGVFHVLEAQYWSPKNRIDVTMAVRNKVEDGKLTVTADNALGGDPGLGAGKSLTVRYQYGDRILVRTIREGETMSLP